MRESLDNLAAQQTLELAHACEDPQVDNCDVHPWCYTCQCATGSLLAVLQRIDGRQYGAYHDIEGVWPYPGFDLRIPRAQSDAYAPPTWCSVKVSASD